VVDVSANRVAIELTGSDRFDLLAHVCPLDLDPRVWATGRCAQTLLGRAQVVLQERSETTGILVRPSFADYVVDLLLAVRGATGDVGA
jgi:sarcosine oxidase subunit gamma